ncbi:MAG: hypothetical protein FWE47_03095 [Oscillospiraceae bacterium]|nr:hypothetical protein [Oscillospiraceae bacterium]
MENKKLPMTILKEQNEKIASMKIKLAEDWKGTFRGLCKEEQLARYDKSFELIESIQLERMSFFSDCGGQLRWNGVCESDIAKYFGKRNYNSMVKGVRKSAEEWNVDELVRIEAHLQADRKMMARELGIESPNRASLKNQIKTARM